MPPTAEANYLFRHALLRQAAYDLLPPTQRAAMHRAALELLEHTAPAIELAHHARAAQDGAAGPALADLQAAEARWCDIAADHAIATFRNDEAARLLDRVLLLPGVDKATQIKALCRRATVAHTLGRTHEPLEFAQRALHAAEALDNRALLGMALRVCGNACLDSAHNAKALDYMRRAAEVLDGTGNTRELAYALTRLSSAEWLAGNFDKGLALAGRAEAMARQAGDRNLAMRARMNAVNLLAQSDRSADATAMLEQMGPIDGADLATQLNYCATRGIVNHYAQRLDEAARWYAEAVARARQGGIQREVARGLTNLGNLSNGAARYAQAMEEHAGAEGIAREIGDVRVLWYALRGQADVAFATGDYSAALERAMAALRVAERSNLPQQLQDSLVFVAQAHGELGRHSEALDVLARHRPETSGPLHRTILYGLREAIIAWAHHQAGDTDAAKTPARRAVRELKGSHPYARWRQRALAVLGREN
ncbi:MAG: hypothetical protein KF696_03910 [Planctomycetes bacterium]|nr:hypothetical protein [Planctomycetota bacterium]MCW8134116.1 hypothetical protein [Planctomycetota bacterium]